MKKRITANWYSREIEGKRDKSLGSRNIGCIILLIIILGGLFLLLCEFLKWGFRYEELKYREQTNDYAILWQDLREENKNKKRDEFKASSLYRCPVKDTELCYKIVKEADKYEVSGQLVIDLSWCESRIRNVRGDIDPRDRGWFQINKYWHPEVSDECAEDLECSANWTAYMIRQGRGWEWHCW